MTAKFRQIIDKLDALVTFKADKSMTDEDFIANIEAVNLLINVHDDLGLDRKRLRRSMCNLYPEFSRRIYGKNDIQFSIPLIKALNDFIFGREEDLGPERWRHSLVEMCCKVVESYRKEKLIPSTDYLFALDIVSRKDEEFDNSNIKKYKEIIDRYIDDIDQVSLVEKIKRVDAYGRAKHLFVSEDWEKWAETREILKKADVRQMDDDTFLLWCDVTDQYPLRELKRRCGNSKHIAVEYLRSQIISEFAKRERLRKKRLLSSRLKTLKDNIIGDIVPLKIDDTMSLSTLYALETIFYLRLTLAQISDDDNSSTYELLCLDRFERIANALEKKYLKAATLNEKIEIIERLSIIGGMIHSHHEDFAIEEADKLKDFPDLTYAQKLRLNWIPSITSEDESEVVAKLLPEANTSFEIATLSLIADFVTDKEREAVLNRYFDLFEIALKSGDLDELGKLLNVAAYWNSNPTIRHQLTEAVNRASSIEALSLPERCVNEIAATIYAQIDKITGKYDEVSDIPA